MCQVVSGGRQRQINRNLRGRSQGATQLHQAGILRYRGCIHLTATSRDRCFFSTNRLATRQNPTSCGRFTLLFLHRYALKAPLVRSAAQRMRPGTHGLAFSPRNDSLLRTFPSNAASSPRNDSLLRTAQALQQLAYVRLAVQASDQIDTPPVNPTNCRKPGHRFQHIDRPQLPTTIAQLHPTTRPTSAYLPSSIELYLYDST